MAGHVEITEANFEQEVLKSDIPILVDFWAEWCAPCKMIAPTLDEIVEESGGKIKLGKVNVDENSQVSSQYGIRSIPTLMLFKNGKVADQIIGAVPKGQITAMLEKALA